MYSIGKYKLKRFGKLNEVINFYLERNGLNEAKNRLCQFEEEIEKSVVGLNEECSEFEPFLRRENEFVKFPYKKLVVSGGWESQRKFAIENRLIFDPLELRGRHINDNHRLLQIIKLLLYSANSGMFSCPLAMTDGTVSVLSHLGNSDERLMAIYKKFISTNLQDNWISGQWMTEYEGGSDVRRGTETIFKKGSKDYELNGHKWFCSAADANSSLVLAKENEKNLTLFLVDNIEEQLRNRNIQYINLKRKFGTKQLATAEILLDKCHAIRLGDYGDGIKNVMPLLSISRLHNCVACASTLRRLYDRVVEFAVNRSSFGQLIIHHPLYQYQLFQLEMATKICEFYSLELSLLLNGFEKMKENEKILRLLIPIGKIMTSKLAVHYSSLNGMELFGGRGYLEESGIPRLIRDVLVTHIWEGTSNILSLDILRTVKSLNCNNELLETYFQFLNNKQITRDFYTDISQITLNELNILKVIDRFHKSFISNCFQSMTSHTNRKIDHLFLKKFNESTNIFSFELNSDDLSIYSSYLSSKYSV